MLSLSSFGAKHLLSCPIHNLAGGKLIALCYEAFLSSPLLVSRTVHSIEFEPHLWLDVRTVAIFHGQLSI